MLSLVISSYYIAGSAFDIYLSSLLTLTKLLVRSKSCFSLRMEASNMTFQASSLRLNMRRKSARVMIYAYDPY